MEFIKSCEIGISKYIQVTNDIKYIKPIAEKLLYVYGAIIISNWYPMKKYANEKSTWKNAFMLYKLGATNEGALITQYFTIQIG